MPSPDPRPGGDRNHWVAVAAGYYHSLGLKADGSLWAWGDNVFGQLGLGSADTAPHPTPVQVGTETNWLAVRRRILS